MAGRGGGEQPAVAEIVDEVAERSPQRDVLGLVADRRSSASVIGNAGLDEHGELTREVHQLLLLDLLLRELEVEHPTSFLDLGREQVLLDQQRARASPMVSALVTPSMGAPVVSMAA